MKIEIEIPDWAMDGYLTLIHNKMETVAYKEPGKSPWMVKASRCNKCGECCLDLGIGHSLADDEGKCKYLVKQKSEYLCNAGTVRQMGCLGDPTKEMYSDCTVEYRKN